MRRREFITLLGGAAATWPIAGGAALASEASGQRSDSKLRAHSASEDARKRADDTHPEQGSSGRAQQTALPVVGMLSGSSAAAASLFLGGFREGLRADGYVEGQNLVIEAQWADGQYDRLPALAAELVRRPVAIILASGLPSVFAAKAATSTVPIVFVSAGDPVQLGIVASFNRQGGNITGVSFLAVEVASKRLELLLEVVPTATVIGLLTNPNNPRTDLEIVQLQAAARTVGKRVLVVKASSERDFDGASKLSSKEGPARSSFPPSRFSSFGASNWSHSRRGMHCPRCMTFASTPRPAGCSAMD
jgi:hypothetical protein